MQALALQISTEAAQCRFEGKWKKAVLCSCWAQFGEGQRLTSWWWVGGWVPAAKPHFNELPVSARGWAKWSCRVAQCWLAGWPAGTSSQWPLPAHSSFLICWHCGAGIDEGTLLPKWVDYFPTCPTSPSHSNAKNPTYSTLRWIAFY